MPYDPTKPANNSPISSAELRNQFAGLAAMVNGVVSSNEMMLAFAAYSAGAVPNVASLNLTVSDPPTQAEVQAIADKIDEMLMLLRRT